MRGGYLKGLVHIEFSSMKTQEVDRVFYSINSFEGTGLNVQHWHLMVQFGMRREEN